MKSLALAALAVLALATVSQAQTVPDVPIFSPQRASLAAVGDYAFYSGSQAPQFPVKKEWRVGLAGGYKLTPTLALTASTRYGVDSKQFESTFGLVLRIWSGTGH